MFLSWLPGHAATAELATLRVGVEGAYPPFSSLGTDGKLKGFDIDIAQAMCVRLNVQCVYVQTEFDAMIPALQAKKFDAIVASMSITPERLKAVDFSDKYYNTPTRFVVRSDSRIEVSPEGLKGRKVGVQRTTIQDRFATATFKASEIVRYAKQDEVFRGPVYDDPAFFGTGAGIAVRKGDTALRDKINAALAAMRADGSYKKLNDRYFDFDVYGAEQKKR